MRWITIVDFDFISIITIEFCFFFLPIFHLQRMLYRQVIGDHFNLVIYYFIRQSQTLSKSNFFFDQPKRRHVANKFFFSVLKYAGNCENINSFTDLNKMNSVEYVEKNQMNCECDDGIPY